MDTIAWLPNQIAGENLRERSDYRNTVSSADFIGKVASFALFALGITNIVNSLASSGNTVPNLLSFVGGDGTAVAVVTDFAINGQQLVWGLVSTAIGSNGIGNVMMSQQYDGFDDDPDFDKWDDLYGDYEQEVYGEKGTSGSQSGSGSSSDHNWTKFSQRGSDFNDVAEEFGLTRDEFSDIIHEWNQIVDNNPDFEINLNPNSPNYGDVKVAGASDDAVLDNMIGRAKW